MTYERVTVVLKEDEMNELRKLAQIELRRPRDQAAYLLRRVLFGEHGALNTAEKSATQHTSLPTGATPAQI